MESILEAFAYNRLEPNPDTLDPASPYGRLMDELSQCEDRLSAALDADGRLLFDEITDLHTRALGLSEAGHFLRGYRLGVRMACEVFSPPSQPLC